MKKEIRNEVTVLFLCVPVYWMCIKSCDQLGSVSAPLQCFEFSCSDFGNTRTSFVRCVDHFPEAFTTRCV